MVGEMLVSAVCSIVNQGHLVAYITTSHHNLAPCSETWCRQFDTNTFE
jgi:hypothetical protein